MEAGAAVEAQAAQQFTPLHFAAIKGHAKVCRMLIKAGAAFNAQDDQQGTPLHMAAQEGHAEVCRVLMEAGAAVGAQDVRQRTPLDLAAQEGHADVRRVLTEGRAAIGAASAAASAAPAASAVSPSFLRQSPTTWSAELVADWSAELVADWLGNFGAVYAKYGDAFIKNGINGEELLDDEFGIADLEELGVTSMMHQKRVMKEIRKLKQ
jgi:hypothetical protein